MDRRFLDQYSNNANRTDKKQSDLNNLVDTFQRPVTKYFFLCGQLEYDSQKNVDKPQSSRYNIHHTQLSDKRQGIRSVGESDRQKYYILPQAAGCGRNYS